MDRFSQVADGRVHPTGAPIDKTVEVPMETVIRRWTITTWLVAGHGDQTQALDLAIADLGSDVVLLQSIRDSDVERLADGLGARHAWALSHYPRSRLMVGSGVGLATLTPHRIAGTSDVVVSDQQSAWSRDRRIAQMATVVRPDHSSYRFVHAVAPTKRLVGQLGDAPTVQIHPARIDGDPSQAVELPDGASLVSLSTHRPIPNAANLLSVTFEMPWVQGDFPVI